MVSVTVETRHAAVVTQQVVSVPPTIVVVVVKLDIWRAVRCVAVVVGTVVVVVAAAVVVAATVVVSRPVAVCVVGSLLLLFVASAALIGIPAAIIQICVAAAIPLLLACVVRHLAHLPLHLLDLLQILR